MSSPRPQGRRCKRDQASKQPSLKEAGKKAEIPVVYVEFGPAELIETKGDPVYKAIPGTGLEYAENTNGNIFRLGAQYYILISGRWFRGAFAAGAMGVRVRQRAATGLREDSFGQPEINRSGVRARHSSSQRSADRKFDSADGEHHPFRSETHRAVRRRSDVRAHRRHFDELCEEHLGARSSRFPTIITTASKQASGSRLLRPRVPGASLIPFRQRSTTSLRARPSTMSPT